MRALGLGLAAALMIVAAASSAFAAKDPAAIDPASRTAGMAGAPTAIRAAQVPCTLTDARYLGEAPTANKVPAKFYEVACQEGLGYVLGTPEKAGASAIVFDCVMTSTPAAGGKPNPLACKLPGNANPAPGLTPIMAKAGRDCVVDQARYIGKSQDTDAQIYEVACHQGGGFILTSPSGAGATGTAEPCLSFAQGSAVQCTLTTHDQQLMVADQLMTTSGKPCAVKNRRYIGADATHNDYFEVACADGKGYIVSAAATGKFKEAIDCAQAANVGGGCTMTDARQAMTAESAVYTDLAKKAGFDCAVSKYADFPTPADGAEVVELACSNRTDGAVGRFPARGAPEVWDCMRSQVEGYKCSFSTEDAVYPKLSAQLKAKGKPSCVVNGARPYGRGDTGSALIEVSCADGNPGWVLDYPAHQNDPSDVLNCAQAAASGAGGCQLPTNKAH